MPEVTTQKDLSPRYNIIVPLGSDNSAFPGDDYTAIIIGKATSQYNRLFGVGMLLPITQSPLAKLSLRYDLNFRYLYSKLPPVTFKELSAISKPFARLIEKIAEDYASDEIRRDGRAAVKSEVAHGIILTDYATEIGMALVGSGPQFCFRQNWCTELGEMGIGAYLNLGAVHVEVSNNGESSGRWYFGRGGGGHISLSPVRFFNKSYGIGIVPLMVDASMTMVFTSEDDFRLLFFSANYLLLLEYQRQSQPKR